MPFIPYLSFQGQCAEAFAFYGRVFGATPQTHAFADMPADSGAPPLPPETREGFRARGRAAQELWIVVTICCIVLPFCWLNRTLIWRCPSLIRPTFWRRDVLL